MMFRPYELLLILLATAFYQCSGSSTGPTPSPPAISLVLSTFSGNGTSGIVGNTLTAELSILLEDQDGNAISGRQIDFSVTLGAGSVSPASSTTNSEGIASTTVTWGDEEGTVQVNAVVSGTNVSTDFQVTATLVAVSSITVVSGNDQIGEPGAQLKNPIVVEARDVDGNPVNNALILFSNKGNMVSFTSNTVSTGEDGRAENFVTVNDVAGSITFPVSGGSGQGIISEVNLFSLGADRIVYSTVLPNSGIYIMNPDGSGQINIAGNAFEPNAPAWSPDGGKIVFKSFNNESQAHDLYTINFDGSDRTLLFSSQLRLFEPSWSPSGELIIFALENQDGQDRHLYTINADGTGLRQLTDTRNTRDAAPFWSSDSEKIIFERDADIYTINIDGTELTPLIEGENLYFHPSWSSDGSKILYTQFNTTSLSWNIHVMHTDGSIDISLTNDQGLVLFPAWSPDDSQIIYTCFSDLYIMNADGGGRTKITDSFHDEAAPKWGRKR